jgi:hypothetical protein
MICPFCSQDIQELWQPFLTENNWQGTALPRPERRIHTVARRAKRKFAFVNVKTYWAQCPKCNELIVKIHRTVALAAKGTENGNSERLPVAEETSWFALPLRTAPPPVSNLVPEGMARDYREAFLILEDGPRMSSVLSRRILADLLEQYVKIKGPTLAAQIDKFIGNKAHPARHRQNLHYLREIGNFSAHTKTDTKGNTIDVTREEAEWTLRVVSELFAYFIVDPETDRAIRDRIDQKLKDAGRKPIKGLPEAGGEESEQH